MDSNSSGTLTSNLSTAPMPKPTRIDMEDINSLIRVNLLYAMFSIQFMIISLPLILDEKARRKLYMYWVPSGTTHIVLKLQGLVDQKSQNYENIH